MNIDQVGQQIARKNLNIQPTFEIEPAAVWLVRPNFPLIKLT